MDLTNPNMMPTDELVRSALGTNEVYWKDLHSYLADKHPVAAGEWRYYNDGKQWLYKTVKKSKTLYWTNLMEDTFRVTFYFGNKAEPLIDASMLPTEIKEGFRNGKRFGQLRAITIEVRSAEDLANICQLIELKDKLK